MEKRPRMRSISLRSLDDAYLLASGMVIEVNFKTLMIIIIIMMIKKSNFLIR